MKKDRYVCSVISVFPASDILRYCNVWVYGLDPKASVVCLAECVTYSEIYQRQLTEEVQ